MTQTLPELVRLIETQYPGAVLAWRENPPDNDELVLQRDRWATLARFLKTHPALDFKLMVDLCVADLLAWPDWDPDRDDRFVVALHLYSLTRDRRLRVKVGVPEAHLHVDSVSGVWKAALWPEREAWEMYGVVFDGHPNLDFLFLYEGFEGHPLRKDYPLKGQQPVAPLRRPIPLREEPARITPRFEQDFFIAPPVDRIDNRLRLPSSMLRPGWREELRRRRDEDDARAQSGSKEPRHD